MFYIHIIYATPIQGQMLAATTTLNFEYLKRMLLRAMVTQKSMLYSYQERGYCKRIAAHTIYTCICLVCI